DVYARVSRLMLFDGIADTWNALRDGGVYLGVVTHSPRSYATRVLDHVGLAPDALIAYHDLNGKRKPSSYGYERCANGRAAGLGVAVGDERSDLIAADNFGSTGVFAGWSRSPSLTADDCHAAGWIFVPPPVEIVKLVIN